MQFVDWEAGLFMLTMGFYLLAAVITIFLPADRVGSLGKKNGVDGSCRPRRIPQHTYLTNLAVGAALAALQPV